jgi:hypothetical protein
VVVMATMKITATTTRKLDVTRDPGRRLRESDPRPLMAYIIVPFRQDESDSGAMTSGQRAVAKM